jgi:hypothetical protein
LVRVQPGEFRPSQPSANPHSSTGQACQRCPECSHGAYLGAYLRSTLRIAMSEPVTFGPVKCNRCGRLLDEPVTLPADERSPCPDCGSLVGVKDVTLAATSTAEASLATRVIASVVAAYTAAQYIVRPPAPEPGYHRAHDPHDP